MMASDALAETMYENKKWEIWRMRGQLREQLQSLATTTELLEQRRLAIVDELDELDKAMSAMFEKQNEREAQRSADMKAVIIAAAMFEKQNEREAQRSADMKTIIDLTAEESDDSMMF